MQSFGDLSAMNKEMLFGRHGAGGGLDSRCFEMLTAGAGGGGAANMAGLAAAAAAAAAAQQQQHSAASSVASMNAADYTFFPNALAAAFLCPTPASAFSRCAAKMDSEHPSPLFFQATGFITSLLPLHSLPLFIVYVVIPTILLLQFSIGCIYLH